MKFTILTLCPEAFPGTLGISVPGKSIGKDWFLNVVNIRNYGIGKYKQVDDEVYGGGSGMLLRPDVVGNALNDCITGNDVIISTSPRGFTYNQKMATNFANCTKNIIIICGRFEGIDYRVIEKFNILEVSIGNFVIFGGEVAAMCIMESILRLKNGICGNALSIEEDSFAVDSEYENLMEYPQFTRPEIWNEIKVPEVLLSGHHKNIKEWRLQQAKNYTKFYQDTNSKIF